MDFGLLDGKSDEGAEMVVLFPGTNNPMDAVIRLAGMDSKAWRAAVKQYADNVREKIKKSKSPSNEMMLELKISDETKASWFAAITIDWKEVMWNGEPLECTVANAKKLYDSAPWLCEQINIFIANRSNFFRPVAGAASDGGEGEGAAAAATKERQE